MFITGEFRMVSPKFRRCPSVSLPAWALHLRGVAGKARGRGYRPEAWKLRLWAGGGCGLLESWKKQFATGDEISYY